MSTRKSATESRAPKGPRKRLQDYLDENTSLKEELERLTRPVDTFPPMAMPERKSDAARLTEEIESLNGLLKHQQTELGFHKNEVHNLELSIATSKLNLFELKSQLASKLTAPEPLV